MPSPRSSSDFDISTRGPAPSLGWRGWLIWLAIFLVALPMLLAQIDVLWVLLAVFCVAFVSVVGSILWVVIIRRGIFTWMRLACKPARLMARGETAAAELACTQALARARRFAATDYRRGMMLCELAMFVKHQGRYPEAIALFEEAVEILREHFATQPLNYLVVLNNYSICFIHLKDYVAAQRILERVIDLIFTAKKRDQGAISRLPQQPGFLFQFVIHLNFAFLLIEMEELAEADRQLREADTLLPMISQRTLGTFADHHVTLNALWDFEAGHFADADAELKRAKNPDYPACLRIRASLHGIRREFAEAERLLRKYLELERKKGTLHRPELLKTVVLLADCLFEQGKREDAVAAAQEACKLVADYALPMDAYWRRTTRCWLDRAATAGNAELTATLTAEAARVPAANPAITILDRYRNAAP